MQQRATEELNTTLYYRRIDVRDTDHLNDVIEEIANREGRLDGLVAAAGIQQETPALEYTAKDANTMFEVNVTGVFMTAQAAAKQMIRFGNGGSIVMIASMSGTVANRVGIFPSRVPIPLHRAPCMASEPSSLLSTLCLPWSRDQRDAWGYPSGRIKSGASRSPHSTTLPRKQTMANWG